MALLRQRLAFCALLLLALTARAQSEDAPPADTSFYGRLYAPFQGDLPEMRQRRLIRVLISPSRTNFYFDGHKWRGLEYELLRRFEQFLNRGPRRKRYITHLVFMPVPFDAIIDGVRAGRGDIGAAGLTITPSRARLVDFTLPYLTGINEILVTGMLAEQPHRLEDLAGKKIVVVRGSSYATHLNVFNQALIYRGLPPMQIVLAEPELEAEDLLELLNEGLIDYTVVDSHLAHAWARVLNNIRPRDDFVFHYGGRIAWAVRKNNPKLKQALNRFIKAQAKPGSLLSNILFQRYFENARWLRNPIDRKTLRRFYCYQPRFEELADFFDLSWTLLAAVAYVESGLDPKKRSHAGAIGLMQVRRLIARKFGIRNLKDPFENMLAGASYLAWLRDNYFSSPVYSTDDRINFTLAAYNAGPTRIRQLQREAKKAGLNPFRWFFNVELIARKRIGRETVDYVSRVRKTQVAIRMLLNLQRRKLQVRDHLMESADTP
ncbi:transporter substrate-binding domain-containing protein [Sulfurivirga sp.]|uniref:transglycosylase SLT domain-containing protein n=1 Tax=Sulfurivirga sp. TaxID=2614236 RepID=UPI0025ED1DA3|nr:transporter substrate-binding domain-containing protein [Sulfurivirga sp.]